MSDTPETDAVAAIEGNWDTKALRMTNHACKMERERDEAKAEWYSLQDAFEDSCDKIEKLEREQDEARDQLIHLRSCVYDVIHSLKAGAFDELEKAWKEGLK
jgi:predicted  nucleic acid-binding Zn-ribbon protein